MKKLPECREEKNNSGCSLLSNERCKFLQMNSISKISKAALERMFQEGKAFKNSNGGITVKTMHMDYVRTGLGFYEKPSNLVFDLHGNFSISSDEYTHKVKFHLYGLEFGLETLSEELINNKVLLVYIIGCNPRSVATGRIPFYLVVEIQRRYTSTNKIDRWCFFYTFTQEERENFERYCLAEAKK